MSRLMWKKDARETGLAPRGHSLRLDGETVARVSVGGGAFNGPHKGWTYAVYGPPRFTCHLVYKTEDEAKRACRDRYEALRPGASPTLVEPTRDGTTLRAVRQELARYGGCNFCNARPLHVWVVSGEGRALECRFCDACIAALKEQTR